MALCAFNGRNTLAHRCSDAIAQFLAKHVRHAFVVSGGANLHMVHSISDTPDIDFVCMQHEQACSFAADAYARMHGLGCVITTSGPGATNGLTGLAASYYDSVPVLHIYGQVTVGRMAIGWGVRQYGFQFTPIIQMAKPVCKYATEVMKPEDCIPELEKCIRIAREARMGPCLLSVPDDIQRAEIQI